MFHLNGSKENRKKAVDKLIGYYTTQKDWANVQKWTTFKQGMK